LGLLLVSVVVLLGSWRRRVGLEEEVEFVGVSVAGVLLLCVVLERRDSGR
jgi:uncharacterized membrane protein